MQVKQLIQQASKALSAFDTAVLDAQLLLAQVLEKDRTWLYTWDDTEVGSQQQQSFQTFVERRAMGEPIAHILGYREFWSLKLACNNSTLIPRPETEHLVETALELSLSQNAQVLDLGTGTGAIALALGNEQPSWQIDAVDFSEEAVDLARSNGKSNKITNVSFLQSDWFQQIGSSMKYDLIVSNPPYIDPENENLKQGDVRFEPKTALIAENKGMADLELIISEARNYLKIEGWLVLEHGFDQEQPVQDSFLQYDYKNIKTINDLAGLPRISYAQFVAR